MIVRTVVNGNQKEALIKASQAVGLSYSSFMRQAAIEKINRMGIQINTSQGTNLDSPASHVPVKDGGANGRTS